MEKEQRIERNKCVSEKVFQTGSIIITRELKNLPQRFWRSGFGLGRKQSPTPQYPGEAD